MFVVRRSNNTFGDRCFASAGPRLWNTLPAHLRQRDSLRQFKRLLKTHLFDETAALCDIFVRSAVYKSSYLLTYCSILEMETPAAVARARYVEDTFKVVATSPTRRHHVPPTFLVAVCTLYVSNVVSRPFV